MLVEQRSELLRREDPVALSHELANLLPVCVVGETHPNTIMAGSSRDEEWTANRQQRFAFFRGRRATRVTVTELPVEAVVATSKQNDLRRMSNDSAVDSF